MTSNHTIEGLRAEVPTLEPDPMLLTQLVQLSSAKAPAATAPRASAVKVLLAAAGVAAVTATTWAAGAVPGVPSPIRPAHHPHPAITPSPFPTDRPATRIGAPDPTSGAPGSIRPTPDGRPDEIAPGAPPTVQPSGGRHLQEHTGAHPGSSHPHQDPGPTVSTGPSSSRQPQRSANPFGLLTGQRHRHGTSGHGSGPRSGRPGGTPTDGLRSSGAAPTDSPRVPSGQETTPP